MDFEWLDVNTLVLATTSAIASLLYYVSTNDNRSIRNLQNAPNLEVGAPLKSVLQDQDQTFLPYVAIRGRVIELGSKTIKSDSGHVGVMQMVSLNEHSMRQYASGFWGSAIREIGSTLNDVPFGLKSISDLNPIIVEIVDPLQATHENLLSTVSTKFTPATPGLGSVLMGYFMGNASTGIETKETLLSLDTKITAIGELSVSSGKYRLSMPLDKDNFPYILSTLNLERIIESKMERQRDLRLIAYILFGVAAFFAIRKAMKLWKVYELKQMSRRILRERAERTERNDTISALSNQDHCFCVVCLTNPREVILIPCGHVVVCLDCLERLDNKCPVCRRIYSQTYAAYVS